ncbi:MAG: RCC1 domain-containing protein, partial [Puniceicoccales bacterium]
DTIVERPLRVGTDTWIAVAAGRTSNSGSSSNQSFSLGVKSDGTLWVWGRGAGVLNGQGLSGTAAPNGLSPAPVPNSTARTWVDVEAGNVHALALASNGQIYAWGQSTNGQLGLGTQRSGSGNLNLEFPISATYPTRVGTQSNWTSISTGSYQSYAINNSGQLFAWGLNSSEQLGQPVTFNEQTFDLRNINIFVPTQISSVNNVTSVDGGRDDLNSGPRLSDNREITGFTLLTGTAAGDQGIFTIGGNMNGQLGTGTITFLPSYTPVRTSADGLSISITPPILDPTTIGVNSLNNISVTVANTGPIPVTADYTVEIFISTDETLSVNDDVSIATRTVTDTLPINSTNELNFPDVLIGDRPPGTYYLISRVSLPDSTIENSSPDTFGVQAISVVRPSLLLSNLNIAGGTTINAGQSFSNITLDLSNQNIGIVPVGTPLLLEVFLLSDLSFDPEVDLSIPSSISPLTTITYDGGLNAVAATTPPPPLTHTFTIPTLNPGIEDSGQEFYKLVFVINRNGTVGQETGVTKDNFIVQQVKINALDPVGPAIDYGNVGPLGGNDQWLFISDTLAMNSDALQSPELTPGNSSSFTLPVFGPTTINAPWLIDAGPNDTLKYTLTDANGDPITASGGGDFSESISGFNPTYTPQLIVVDANSTLYNETLATAPYPWTIEWTYEQVDAVALAFARVDLEVPVFLPNPNNEEFLGTVDPSAPVNGNAAMAGVGMEDGDVAVLNLDVDLTENSLVKFWWRTAGDAGVDVMTFAVDGIVQTLPTEEFDINPSPAAISGDTNWRQVAFPVESGPHTLRWTFRKDSENPNARAFIDGLQILEPIPATNLYNRDNPDPALPLPLYSFENIPPSNVDMTVETVIATPGTYILDDSNGTGRLPISVAVTNIGADFESLPS